MKALEFQTKLNPDDSLKVPEEVAARIPRDTEVQVIILFPEESEETDWLRLAREQFFRGYSEGDGIYDAV